MSNPTPSLDELKLAPEVLELSKRMEKEFKIEGGVINVDKSFYESTLPADLTIAQVNAVQKHRQVVAEAASLALSHLGTAHVKKNKDAHQVELVLPMAKDRFECLYDRVKERPVPGSTTGEKSIKYGVLTPSFVANGAVGSRGGLKKIRAYSSDFAAAALGG